MQILQIYVGRSRYQEKIANTRFPMKKQSEQTDYRHPEVDRFAGINRLDFHLLAIQPKLGSCGWSGLGRSVTVVASRLGT